MEANSVHDPRTAAALREKAVAAKSAIADLAVEAKDYAAERMSSLKGRAGERMDSAREHVTSYIREKPFQAVAIAVGVGFLLGFILKRR